MAAYIRVPGFHALYLKRVKNTLSPVKKALSPRKKRRIAEKENGKASEVSIDQPIADHITEDVFLTTSSNVGILPPGHFPTRYGTYFHQNSSPETPTGPPAQSYHEFTLSPPPDPPKSRRATVEEVPDEDDVSYLAAIDKSHPANQSTASLDSLDSICSKLSENETPAFTQAAAADPESQDAYANVYDAFAGPGRLREAPTILKAAAAVKDLSAALRGESQGVSGGYKDPKHDPFVRIRLEGMRIFLNLYTDARSKTYGHWGASAMQAAVGLGRGTYCMRSLCQLARQYIHDRKLLVVNPYGSWKETMLADEDLAADINLYLQEIGNALHRPTNVTG
ncbi:hypothetical protein C8F04DRAFT_1275055 [Mycena alexandri]|uniref:Uncharacterized protein n=1 Tax=Mycena alexandri TaxID=1745969 RepID=A0AAD6S3A8_9AGAR|nr:hypothetical protein C8F04DRAFT_1275055 [Mycena alexandri]